jgi:hypothetical protein
MTSDWLQLISVYTSCTANINITTPMKHHSQTTFLFIHPQALLQDPVAPEDSKLLLLSV